MEMSKAFFDREEARLEVKDAEDRLTNAVLDLAEANRAWKATDRDWPQLKSWVGVRKKQMNAAAAKRWAEEWLAHVKAKYARASEAYEKEQRDRETARKREETRNRILWFRGADNAVFHAHINAARTRRWNGGDKNCNDSVEDLYHTQRGEVPSTYGRRQPFIMAELDRKGYTTQAFERMGTNRNDYVRGAVARQALPFIDVENINAYKKRLEATNPKPKVNSMPWLDPAWEGWDEDDV